MKEIVLLKCGELVLKGLNKSKFERRLIENIKFRLSDIADCKVYVLQSTIYVEPCDDSANAHKIADALTTVFGVTTISVAAVCEKNIEDIFATSESYLKDKLADVTTFKVESKRADKKFPMTSIEISMEVGGHLHEIFPHLVPQMKNPEVTVYVEVRDRKAYIHAHSLKGAGGMPTGTSGRAMMLLSGGIDSPVAGYMMAKRGLELDGIHFFSYPYTSERAKLKVIDLANIVSRYSGKMNLHVVHFTQIQEAIRKDCPEELFTIIMRRFMMRISDRLASENKCGALITGESLGQVASQTMDAMAVTNAVCNLPVFRPAIGLDKEEIITISRKIDAFETSILPYEDCCTVFTPKHPSLRPKLHIIEKYESRLDIDALINDAISKTEIIKIRG